MNTLKDIKKNLKAIEFVFENTESMCIPIECINKLDFEIDNNNKNVFTYLNCVIKNNGSIKSYPDDSTSPILRLSKWDDICNCNFIFKNGLPEDHSIEWYVEDNPYIIEQSNKGQSSNLLRYNIIEILIKPYIPTYTIQEIFSLPIGTHIQDEEGNKYIILPNEQDIKTIDLYSTCLTEKSINMKFTKID